MLDTITVGQMPFEFPDEFDPVRIEDDHEQSLRIIAGSLLLPHLEPYLIRSMKAAQPHVTDPKILEGLKGFAAQEGQHYRMHIKFNEAIRRSGFADRKFKAPFCVRQDTLCQVETRWGAG